MARLNISPSELRSRASELESQRQQHLQTMQRLRVCINTVSYTHLTLPTTSRV